MEQINEVKNSRKAKSEEKEKTKDIFKFLLSSTTREEK